MFHIDSDSDSDSPGYGPNGLPYLGAHITKKSVLEQIDHAILILRLGSDFVPDKDSVIEEEMKKKSIPFSLGDPPAEKLTKLNQLKEKLLEEKRKGSGKRRKSKKNRKSKKQRKTKRRVRRSYK